MNGRQLLQFLSSYAVAWSTVPPPGVTKSLLLTPNFHKVVRGGNQLNALLGVKVNWGATTEKSETITEVLFSKVSIPCAAALSACRFA